MTSIYTNNYIELNIIYLKIENNWNELSQIHNQIKISFVKLNLVKLNFTLKCIKLDYLVELIIWWLLGGIEWTEFI